MIIPLKEDGEISCRVLLKKIAETDDQLKRKVLLHDFASRVKDLRQEAKLYYLANLYESLIDGEIREIMEKTNVKKISIKPRADVAVITIKKPELYAAKVALKINRQERASKIDSGYRYWETTVVSKHSEQQLNVVLTMVGHDRGINCANACRTLYSNYDVNLFMLVGMGAGLEGKVNLGDVVAATTVWDISSRRLEPDGEKKRPDPFKIGRALSRNIEYFDPDQLGWKELVHSYLPALKEYGPIPEVTPEWKPDFHSNNILSGTDLAADGSVRSLIYEYDERARLYEMEASGFACTCDELGVPWLVFKGVSDFGDPKTKDTLNGDEKSRKIWQLLASLSASAAALNFLENDYLIQEKTF